MEKSEKGGSGVGGTGTVVERGQSSMRTAETLLRVVPMAFCVTAMVIMLKNTQNNDFGSVSYSGLGAFRFLVYANGICAGYSFLSAFFTAVNRSSAPAHSRLWSFFFFDQVMTYVILAAGAVSAEVVYLARNGDTAITWSETCGTFGGFCKKATDSMVITFATMACYAVLSLLSSYRLFSNYDVPCTTYPRNNNKAAEMLVFST